MTTIITVRVPDPAALGWEKRDSLRESMAYTVRWELGLMDADDTIGVDILPREDG